MCVARFAIIGGGFHLARIVAEADAGLGVHGDNMGRFIPYDEAAARRVIGGIEGGEKARGDRVGNDDEGEKKKEKRKKCGNISFENRWKENYERDGERDEKREVAAARKSENIGDENEDGGNKEQYFRATC